METKNIICYENTFIGFITDYSVKLSSRFGCKDQARELENNTEKAAINRHMKNIIFCGVLRKRTSHFFGFLDFFIVRYEIDNN